MLIIVGLLCIVALVWLVVSIYISSRASGSMLKSISEIYKGKKMGFSSAWKAGNKYWLKLFLQRLLFLLPIFIIVIPIIAVFIVVGFGSAFSPVAMFASIFSLIIILCLALCCVLILVLAINVIAVFVRRELVIEEKSVIDSIRSAYNFVIRNLLELFVSFVFLLPVTIVAIMIGLVLVVGLLVAALPVVLFLITVFETAPILAVVSMVVGLFCFAILLGFIQGPIIAFQEVYWTVVYLELKKLKK